MMTDDTSPAVKLRSSVVLLVVASLVLFGLIAQAEIGILVTMRVTVPAELWVAAATPVASLTALLVNTKHESTVPAPVQIVNAPTDPVPVDASPGPDGDPVDPEGVVAEQPRKATGRRRP